MPNAKNPQSVLRNLPMRQENNGKYKTKYGYVFPKEMSEEGIKKHFETMLTDVEFTAEEFNKINPHAAISLFITSQAIKEGSIRILYEFIEGFMAERQMCIEEGTWEERLEDENS